jgi:hypothetical protein
MTLSLMILPASAKNFVPQYNDKGSGADGDVQFWRPVGQTTGQGSFLPVGDVCEASSSPWVYNSNPPLGQVILVGGALGVDVVNPSGFNQVWNDKGSGADLNGAIWEMIVPDGFIALGHCCTFAASGDPPQPNPANYFCVAKSAITTAIPGAQIWNTFGSDVVVQAGIYNTSATVAFVDLHTFWANRNTEGPPTTIPGMSALLSGPSFVSAPGPKTA